MKKVLIIIVLIMNLASISAQNLISFNGFGGVGDNQVFKSVIDNNNNIYIVGQFSGTINAGGSDYTAYGTNNDAYITKFDQDGNFVWFKQLGSSDQNDLINGLTISKDGSSLFVTGSFYGSPCNFWDGKSITNYSSGTADAFILIINTSDGSINNLKGLVYGPSSQFTQSIKLDNSNIILIGYVVGNGNTSYFSPTESIVCNGPRNYYILSLNSSLDINWYKKYEGNDGNNNFYSLDIDESGYYIAGMNRGTLTLDIATLNSQSNSVDMFLFKTDKSGNGQWVRSIKGSGADASVYTTCDHQGHIYISGYYASTDLKVDSTATLQSTRSIPNKGNNDIFFAKYTTDGNLIWFDIAGSTGDDKLTRLSTFNNYLVIAGQYSGAMTFGQQTITPQGGTDAFGVVHDANDNVLYAISAGGSGTDVYQTCVIDNTGNFFFIGQGNSPTTYFTPTNYFINPTPATRDVFIAKYDKASISIVKNEITCPGSSTGAAHATSKGAMVLPVSFAWTKKGDVSFNANTASITALSAGRYYVKATDAINYSLVDSVDFADPAPISVALTSATNVTCFNGSNGNIDISVSGGTLPYTYAWTTNGGSGINAIVQDQITLTAGSYSVQVTDKNDCSATLNNIAITQPNKVTFAGSEVIKINGASGSVDLSVQGGTPPYSYAWSGASAVVPSDQEDISNILVAGNYTVSVTYAAVCITDTTFFIANSHVLNAYLESKQNVKCWDGSTGSITIATENVTGTAIYTWSPNVGNTATVTNLVAGNYSVSVTDGSTTTAVVNVNISQPPSELTISLARSNITCYNANDGVLDANPAGGTLPYTFNWTKEAQPYDGGDETQINLAEGAYAVTVTDVNNCTASANQSITNPTVITFNGLAKDVTCEAAKNDGAITLSNIQGGTGSYTYLWSNGLTSQNVDLLSANNYTVTVTDDNNCKTSNNFIVGYESPILVSFNKTNVTCNGAGNGMLDAQITGGHSGFTYYWNTGATAQSISGLLPGSYNVTVTDSKLCTKTATGIITEPLVLSIASVAISNVSCNGGNNGSVSLTIAGGTPQYLYYWDQGAGTAATASSLPAGTFNVTVTDVNNCTTNGSYIIIQPDALSLTENVNARINPLCNGLTTGSITLLPAGGSGEYEYSMNSGGWGSSAVYNNLGAADYTFKLRDKNAITCEYTLNQAITITQPSAISIVSTISLDPTQKNPWNGSLTLVATGGNSPISYTLNPGLIQQTDGNFTNLAPGDYTVSITDANNCAPITSPTITLSDATRISMVDGDVLKIYPIPATDFINIEYEGTHTNKLITIALYSIGGKIMFGEKVTAETLKDNTYRIDVTNMPKGMYILKINDTVANEKIIIQ